MKKSYQCSNINSEKVFDHWVITLPNKKSTANEFIDETAYQVNRSHHSGKHKAYYLECSHFKSSIQMG